MPQSRNSRTALENNKSLVDVIKLNLLQDKQYQHQQMLPPHHLHQYNQQPNVSPEYLESLKLYKSIYQKPKYASYCDFTCISGEHGIPRNARIFRSFDPVNTLEVYPKFDGSFRTACYIDFCHAHDYLLKLDNRVLRDQQFDYIVNAIISFMLEWSDDSLKLFAEKYPRFAKICTIISVDRSLDNYAYLYSYYGMPFMKTCIKMVKKFFDVGTTSSVTFNWLCLFQYDFVDHIRHVYDLLIENRITSDVVAALEAYMPIRYQLKNICDDVEAIRGTSSIKFITGQACCGKTTLLNEFRKLGWHIYSRGDCGSFGGKATNPAQVGCLHSALEFVLSRSDVIGDRGTIDNILWAFIMEACDPKKKFTLVDDMFKFFNANFNEPAIANFISQRGAIFIDPLPYKNADRMLCRSTEGDSYRSRIDQYPKVQFIVYYTAARLFGWRVFCVPYDANQNFNPQQYINIGASLQKYFGPAIPTNRDFVRFAKPNNNYILNNEFPKSVGIFK